MIPRKIALPRQFLLAATLATGFGTLWFVVVLWLSESIDRAWPDGNRRVQEGLVIRADGTPLIQTTPIDNLSMVTYRDLKGRAEDVVDSRNRLQPVYIGGGELGDPGFAGSRLSWEHRMRVFLDEREPTAVWFFVHDGKSQGAGTFVGYERQSNRRIGFIGLAGFRAHSVPAGEWIPVRGAVIRAYSSWSSVEYSRYSDGGRVRRPERWDLPPRLVYVPSGNLLRMADLAARTVTTVFEAPEPIESVRIPFLSAFSTGHVTTEQPILVRTRQKIYALDHQHHVLRVFTLPAEIDLRSGLYWTEIGNGQAIVDCYQKLAAGEADDDTVTRKIVYRIAADGAILESFELALRTPSRMPTRLMQEFVLALGLPAPAIQLTVSPMFLMGRRGMPAYLAAVRAMLKESWPGPVAVLALSSVLATIAWRRCRAFGLSRREQIAWGVFVLLLGFPGSVGFSLSRRWPVRERCPHCRAQAARDRTACAECGTRFPDPPLKGIEIFA